MPQTTNLCRLCVDICPDSQNLYDENGHGNELYKIIYKYFHPKIVDMSDAKELTAICLQCSSCIQDFHKFEMSIVMAQLTLHGGVPMDKEIKTKKEVVAQELKVEAGSSNVVVEDGQEEFVALSQVVVMDDDPPITGPGLSDAVVLVSSSLLVEAEFLVSEEMKTEMHIAQPELEIIDIASDSDCSLNDGNQSGIDEAAQGDISSVPEEGGYTPKVNFESIDHLLAKWIPRIECVHCRESYENLRAFESHFRRMHPNNEFYITCCSRALRNRTRIKDHLILHEDPDAFKCGICGNSYTNRKTLLRHIDKKHPNDQKFVCSVCGKGVNTERGLKYHLHNTHKIRGRTRPKVVTTEDKHTVYTCNECGHISKTMGSHKHHMWYHHRVETSHQCTFCLKKFNVACALREHEAIEHTGEELYACSFCHMKFRKIDTARQHWIKDHAMERQTNFYYTIFKNDKDSNKPPGKRYRNDESESDNQQVDSEKEVEAEMVEASTSSNTKC